MLLPRNWLPVAGMAALLACGGDDLEARLARASEQLDEERAVVDGARDAVAERRAVLKQAQEELAASQDELSEAERRFAKLEASLTSSVTDDVLVRAVQKRLLEDDDLDTVAIAARVKLGVVTLSGVVPNTGLRDRALEIAGETPGVASVSNQIELVPAVSAAPQ